jgi:hypothetical protein
LLTNVSPKTMTTEINLTKLYASVDTDKVEKI